MSVRPQSGGKADGAMRSPLDRTPLLVGRKAVGRPLMSVRPQSGRKADGAMRSPLNRIPFWWAGAEEHAVGTPLMSAYMYGQKAAGRPLGPEAVRRPLMYGPNGPKAVEIPLMSVRSARRVKATADGRAQYVIADAANPCFAPIIASQSSASAFVRGLSFADTYLKVLQRSLFQ